MPVQRIGQVVTLLLLVGGIFILTIVFHLREKLFEKDHGHCDPHSSAPEYQFEFFMKATDTYLLVKVNFQLEEICQELILENPGNHHLGLKDIQLHDAQSLVSVQSRLDHQRIIVKAKHRFELGNYSLSIPVSLDLTMNNQSWFSPQQLVLIDLESYPRLEGWHPHTAIRLNIISSDQIISNIPLNQSVVNLSYDQIAFALLYQYHCQSMDWLQLCLPNRLSISVDLSSHLFNLIFKMVPLFETYFSQPFPWKQWILVAIDATRRPWISYPGLAFIDQNILLSNASGEHIAEQRHWISHLLAQQWFETVKFTPLVDRWFRTSLASSISQSLYHSSNDSIEKHSPNLERYVPAVLIDALCHSTTDTDPQDQWMIIDKAAAFITEYRLWIGDALFRSRVHSLLHSSNQSVYSISTILFVELNQTELVLRSMLSGHPWLTVNGSDMHISQFKFSSNCSQSHPMIYPINYRFLNNSFSSINPWTSQWNLSSSIVLSNPFIHLSLPSWDRLLDEMKSLRSMASSSLLNRLLFESFLFNLAEQISVDYPFEFLKFFFHQSLTQSSSIDWSMVDRLIRWYRSMISDRYLNEKFLHYLRTMINPFCPNQFWSKHFLNELKGSVQQMNDEILFDLCCTINHSICLQYLSTSPDPQILLQSIFQLQFTDSTSKNLSINANRSVLLYSDRFIRSVVCQIVRQQNDKYWYELIELLREKPFSSSLIAALACAIRTTEQVDFYLSHLCPPTPHRWFCLANILRYAPIETFPQLNGIDDEYWPTHPHQLIDFLFTIARTQGHFSNKAIIGEFRSLITTWTTKNEKDLYRWLENQHA